MKRLLFGLSILLLLAACTNYGKKVKSGNVEVYYKESISKDDAQHTADLFYEAVKAAGSEGRKSFQLSKPGDTLLLKMAVDESKMGQVNEESFYLIMQMVSDSVFGGKPLNMELTDDHFKSIKTLIYRKPTPEPEPETGYGRKVSSGNVEVYYTDEIGSIMAANLADVLEKNMHPSKEISFQLSKTKEGDFLVRMVSSPSGAADITDADLTEVTTLISKEVLNGAPLVFELTDTEFNAFRSFAYPSDAVSK